MNAKVVSKCIKCYKYYGCVQDKDHLLCSECPSMSECYPILCVRDGISGGLCKECIRMAMVSLQFRGRLIYGC